MSLEDDAAGAGAPVNDAPQPPAASAEPAPAAPAEGDTPPAAEPSLDDDLREVFRRVNPSRDDAGRFAPKDGDKPAAAADDASGQKPDEGRNEPAKPAIGAPQSWPAEKKAAWGNLPSDLQEYIAGREQDIHRQFTQLGQQVKAAEPLLGLVEQHRGVFDRHGIAPEAGLARLLAAQRALDADPVAAIQEIAKSVGVDLSVFAAQPAPQGEAGGQEPANSALLARIAQLEQQLSKTNSLVQSREEQEASALARAAEARQAEAMNAVEAFRSKHPEDFDLVFDDMLAHARALREQHPTMPNDDLLQQALDKARWANPQTRGRLMEEMRKAEDEKRIKAARERTGDAQRVSRVNVQSSPGDPGELSLDDELRATYRRSQAS